MNTQRYDIAAGRNVLNMLARTSPNDYARLMAQLKANAGLGTLGASADEEAQPGFWSKLFSAGTNALTTIADYKLQERYAKEQQDQYEAAARAEMQRQALLAEQARTQQMEYENQVALQRQTQELTRVAEGHLDRFKIAMYGVGGLLGLWVLYRVAQ